MEDNRWMAIAPKVCVDKQLKSISSNEIAGQLTQLGADQHAQLGKSLNALYVQDYNLVTESYSPFAMKFRSTDVPRTIASAEVGLSFILVQEMCTRGCGYVSVSLWRQWVPNRSRQ